MTQYELIKLNLYYQDQYNLYTKYSNSKKLNNEKQCFCFGVSAFFYDYLFYDPVSRKNYIDYVFERYEKIKNDSNVTFVKKKILEGKLYAIKLIKEKNKEYGLNVYGGPFGDDIYLYKKDKYNNLYLKKDNQIQYFN